MQQLWCDSFSRIRLHIFIVVVVVIVIVIFTIILTTVAAVVLERICLVVCCSSHHLLHVILRWWSILLLLKEAAQVCAGLIDTDGLPIEFICFSCDYGLTICARLCDQDASLDVVNDLSLLSLHLGGAVGATSRL